MAPNQQDIADKLIEDFELIELIGDPLEVLSVQYEYLLGLSKKLPPFDPQNRTEENRVHGCLSQVWTVENAREENGHTVIDFAADSDAPNIKGIIAILQMIYSGQTPENILAFDIDGLLKTLNLEKHLRTSRRNGLDGMVKRIKTLAAQHV